MFDRFPEFSADESGRFYQPEIVGQQDQQEQGNREADPEGQRRHGSIAPALVLHQEYEGRGEAGENEDEGYGDDDFHSDLPGMSLQAGG